MYRRFIGKAAFSSGLVTLPKNENQARLLGQYAIDFLKNGKPSPQVYDRVKLFHTDSVLCGVSALALKTNAPTVLRYAIIMSMHQQRGPREGDQERQTQDGVREGVRIA